MALNHASDTQFQGELRTALATLQCLSEYAAEQGDAQASSILYNATALLSLTIAAEPVVAVAAEIACQRHSFDEGTAYA